MNVPFHKASVKLSVPHDADGVKTLIQAVGQLGLIGQLGKTLLEQLFAREILSGRDTKNR